MLVIDFEGWFQCRLATDPDPSDEPRGVSGWTFALAGEPDLDGIIRFHNPVAHRSHGPPVNVTVKAVTIDDRVKVDHPLVGARVDLLDDPIFEGRNGIVAEDATEPIEPFHLGVSTNGIILNRRAVLDSQDVTDPYYSLFSVKDFKDAASLVRKLQDPQDSLSHFLKEQFSSDTQELLREYEGFGPPSQSLEVALVNEFNRLLQGASLYTDERFAQVRLSDEVNALIAEEPKGEELIRLNRCLLEEAHSPTELRSHRRIYEVDPSILQRRQPLPKNKGGFEQNSTTVAETTGIMNYAAFRKQRKAALEREYENSGIQVARAALKKRIAELDRKDQPEQSLGWLVHYILRLEGSAQVIDTHSSLGGSVGTSPPWIVDFWMGGWDADTLSAYTKGKLQIPFHTERDNENKGLE